MQHFVEFATLSQRFEYAVASRAEHVGAFAFSNVGHRADHA